MEGDLVHYQCVQSTLRNIINAGKQIQPCCKGNTPAQELKGTRHTAAQQPWADESADWAPGGQESKQARPFAQAKILPCLLLSAVFDVLSGNI